jgi:hypothetical protein
MMRTFLDVLAGDVGEDANKSRRRPGGAGALQRLRDAMLDPNPAKRPSIDAVLLSAYVDQAATDATGSDASRGTSNLAKVKAAMIAYSKQVSKDIASPLNEIRKARDIIKESWRRGYIDEQQYQQHMKTIEEQNLIIKKQQDLLKQINADPNVADLVKGIHDAVDAVLGTVTPTQ